MEFTFWLAHRYFAPAKKLILAERMAGSARELYMLSREKTERMNIFSKDEIGRLFDAKREADPTLIFEAFLCRADGMRFVSLSSPEYPGRLKNIHNPPYALFALGALPQDESLSVSVVGARMCSEYGRDVAAMLGARLSARGINLISGMAMGIDCAAHAGVLRAIGERNVHSDAGGCGCVAGTVGMTYAVLGCGCDVCYPGSAGPVYENIVEGGGGIISEYPPGTRPDSWHFPQRNRIISGLADVTVIVEARERSGSLITADFAMEQGKDVYAVPGRYHDPLSRGCNRLISQGAGILYDADEFLEDIKLLPARNARSGKAGHSRSGRGSCRKPEKKKNPDPSGRTPKRECDRAVLAAIDSDPVHIGRILDDTGLDIPTVLAALGVLREAGLIEECLANYYRLLP